MTTQLPSLYAPVLDDLARVKQGLKDLAVEANYPVLADMLDHILDTPGKVIRPAVTMLASHFGPEGRDNPLLMARAVELLHIATLIHDDTVDRSSLRRGKATIHSLWGEKVAVLVGDYVFALSATCVCDTGNVRVIRRFAETIMELSSGELMEYMAARDWTVTREQYLERIYRKTASLFQTATESGAVLSRAGEDVVQAMREYGYNLGMAFQVMDDILDIEGDAEEVGKPVGSDLLQGTLTLPAILLLERQPKDNPIEALFQGTEPDRNLERAVALIRESSIMRDSFGVAGEFSAKAIAALDLLPDNETRRCMAGLAQYAVQRRV